MAAQKKSTGNYSDAKKALAGMEKATKELQLNIQRLEKAMGTTMEFSPGLRSTGGAGTKGSKKK